MFSLLLLACGGSWLEVTRGDVSLAEGAPVVGDVTLGAQPEEAAADGLQVAWSQWCPDVEDWPTWDVMEEGEYVHFYEWQYPFTELCLIVPDPQAIWYYGWLTFTHERGTVIHSEFLSGMRGQAGLVVGSATASAEGSAEVLGWMEEGDNVRFEWLVFEAYEDDTDNSDELVRGRSTSGSVNLRVDLGDFNREYYPEMFPEG